MQFSHRQTGLTGLPEPVTVLFDESEVVLLLLLVGELLTNWIVEGGLTGLLMFCAGS